MFKRNVLASAVIAASISSYAQAQIEEVVVTSTKRSASTQDIPVAVSAMTEESLEQHGISNFEDYLLQLPGVTAGGSGPGQNTIYIRGVASTTPNLTTAGVAGLAPNVALYLDEQPLAQPGRNLDVYAADLNRVEVLSGPQGTLFGASSQAGTVRLITNKPDHSDTYGKVKLGYANISHGDSSNNQELMFNWAASDNLAVRGVLYRDSMGGYIDNVRGTRTLEDSARFREAGTVRQNGESVSLSRAGVQSQSWMDYLQSIGDGFHGGRIVDFSEVEFQAADNAGLVEDNFNDTMYTGGRVSVSVDFAENWNLLVAGATQDVDSDGVFFADPELDQDFAIERYSDDKIKDSFDNVSWTLKGRIADLELVYSGAFTQRETSQTVDYSDYMYVGQYLPYYICDNTVTYPEYNYDPYIPAGGDFVTNVPKGTCYAPVLQVESFTDTEISTHEIRFSTNDDKSIRLTAGAFYSDTELKERNSFNYEGYPQAFIFGAERPTMFSLENAYASDRSAYDPETVFRNDVKRTDEQFGIFGELTFDLSDNFSLLLGGRYYDIEVDMEGSANSSFGSPTWGADQNAFGTNISDLYDGDGQFTFINDSNTATHITFQQGDTFDEIKAALQAVDPWSLTQGAYICAPNAICDAEIQAIVNALDAPDNAKTEGFIGKLTLNWTPSDDSLFYVTFSEGFRPGLLNRPGGAPGPNNYSVPFELQTDDVTNYEFGWKTDLADGQLRFNGSIFFIEIEKLQVTMFDPNIVNLFFSDNAADAKVTGLETDFIWAPNAVEGLTISGAASVLDTEITEVLLPTTDVREGDPLAFAPELQLNLQARYEWSLDNGMTAHVMPHISYSDESYSDIIRMNRDRIDSWTMAGITAGLTTDTWTAEFYVDNLTDERAEVSRNFVFDVQRVSYAKPLTTGVRVSYNF